MRAFPGSRRYPHFGRGPLTRVLRDAGIEYLHAPGLGGRRKPRPGAAPTAWRNDGFAGFADYMTTAAFRRGVDELLVWAGERRTTIMCSEAVPWRCHRSMISDAVVARGGEVAHILGGNVSPHRLTQWAVIEGDEVRYPDRADEQPGLPLTGA